MEMLAGMQNTVASSGTSAYGKKLMEKMGWSEWVVAVIGNGVVERVLERMELESRRVSSSRRRMTTKEWEWIPSGDE